MSSWKMKQTKLYINIYALFFQRLNLEFQMLFKTTYAINLFINLKYFSKVIIQEILFKTKYILECFVYFVIVKIFKPYLIGISIFCYQYYSKYL